MSNLSTRVSSVFRRELFKGRSAIVTGGATGIGKAITEELLFLGCKVMIASRNELRLKTAVTDLRKQLPEDGTAELDYMICNIRKEDQVQKLVSGTIERFGKIDFLINNAGGQFMSHAEDISLKGWNAVIETNLTGTFLCCRETFRGWMKDNGGVIVTIIADVEKGVPGISHTGAARSGVDNLTKSLSVEWAPYGIRVNTVAPGSSIYSETAADYYASQGQNPFKGQIPNIPAKRFGTPEEISAAVCFLLSPAAAFISGETIKVDGAHSLYAPSIPWTVPDHNKLPAYTWKNDITDDEQKKQGTNLTGKNPSLSSKL